MVGPKRRTEVQLLFRDTMLCAVNREDVVHVGLEPLFGRREVFQVPVVRGLRDKMCSLMPGSQWRGIATPKTGSVSILRGCLLVFEVLTSISPRRHGSGSSAKTE